MDKLYRYILQSAAEGRIGKEEAVRLVTMVRQEYGHADSRGRDIAIVGMASHIAGTHSPQQFWDDVTAGVDMVGSMPARRDEDIRGYVLDKLGWEPKYQPGAYMEDISSFDYGFFRITPRDARLMDPSQRIFLQTAWEAIEDAGYGGKKLAGTRTGVYVGYSSNSIYHSMILETEPEQAGDALTGNIDAMLPARIAYMLDLKGPSLILDTACSSSSVAIHLACKAIRAGECDAAIAGGIRLNLLPLDNDGLKLGAEADDGRTRTFDEHAAGAGWGEGSAALLLKPLAAAERDNDHIYAVIKGSAINQDGASIGITAPNSSAQAEVLQAAWKDAGIHPETLGWIEAHGTATNLGDPLEIEGLRKAFRGQTNKRQFCAIGTVKTNTGHLYECAGVAGVIKAALSLKHRLIPASVHFRTPNKTIDFQGSPVYVNARQRKWESAQFPRRCGVSAFGLSGTNSHIVLEEYVPDTAPASDNALTGDSGSVHLLTLSAQTIRSLRSIVKRYIDFVERHPEVSVRDLCYTATTGRGHYAHRAALVFEDADELLSLLRRLDDDSLPDVQHDRIRYGQHKVVSGNKKQIGEGEIREATRQQWSKTATEQLRSIKVSSQQTDRLSSMNVIGQLLDVADLYVRGADPDWEQLFTGENRRKLSLPTYAFERRRCWLEVPAASSKAPAIDADHLLYTMEWRLAAERMPTSSEREADKTSAVMLMVRSGSGEQAELLAERFRDCGRPVLIVEWTESGDGQTSSEHERDRHPAENGFQQIGSDHFRIDGSQQSFVRLLQTVQQRSVDTLVHALTWHGAEQLDDDAERLSDPSAALHLLRQQQQAGIDSVYRLVRAIVETDSENDRSMRLVLLTQHSMEVSGQEERIYPERAPLYGIGKALPKEIERLQCRFVDVDEHTPIDTVARELLADETYYAVSFRNGERFEETFAVITSDQLEFDPASQANQIHTEGVYVITGGMGGIGLEVARFLAGKNKNVNLALVGRSGMPPRESWEHILQDPLETDKLKQRIRSLLALEQTGARVECIAADVADLPAMDEALRNLSERYGRINGVFHGAGVSSDGPLADRSEPMFEAIVAPKVYGTRVLDMLTRAHRPDFFVLFSSVATMFSAFGQADYAAANAYLDAYAAYRQKQGLRTIVVNWTTWKETGMAYEGGHVFDTIFKTLPTVDALAGLEQLLKTGLTRALVGRVHYAGAGSSLLQRSGIRLSEAIRSTVDAMKSASAGSRSGAPSRKAVERLKSAADGEGEFRLLGRNQGEFTEQERMLALCCRRAFGYEEIDIYDSFFEMGADSISLMKLQIEIETRMHVPVTVSEMFEHTSVFQLAEHLQHKQGADNASPFAQYPSIRKPDPADHYPVSGQQAGMFLAYKRNPQSVSPNQFRVSLLPIRLEPERMESAVQRMIERHEVLRTGLTMAGDDIVQVVYDTVDFAMEFIQTDEAGAAETIRTFRRPFALEHPPLFRLGLIKVREDKYYLLFDAHHVITDGVSTDQFMRELEQLYKGETVPEPPYQYKDFACWQQQYMQTESMQRQFAFWQEVFATGVPLLDLPTDHPRGKADGFDGRVVRRMLDSERTTALKKQASEAGVTLYIYLLSAYAVLLGKYSAQHDIVIGSPVAGRPLREWARVIGMFINMIPLRIRPEPGMTFAQLLEQVKGHASQAFDHQDYPMSELVRGLGAKSEPGHHPLFDTVFVFQNVPTDDRATGRPLPDVYNLTDYDLTLEAQETDGSLQLRLEYNTNLFLDQTAERILSDYIGLLETVGSRTELELRQLELESTRLITPRYEEMEDVTFHFDH